MQIWGFRYIPKLFRLQVEKHHYFQNTYNTLHVNHKKIIIIILFLLLPIQNVLMKKNTFLQIVSANSQGRFQLATFRSYAHIRTNPTSVAKSNRVLWLLGHVTIPMVKPCRRRIGRGGSPKRDAGQTKNISGSLQLHHFFYSSSL